MNESNTAINDFMSGGESHGNTPLLKLDPSEDPNFKSKMQKSWFLSYINLLFTFSTFRKANKLARQDKMLEEKDIPALGYTERTERLENRIQSEYNKARAKSDDVSLGWVAYRAHKWEFVTAFVLDAIVKTLRVFLVWVAKKLLEAINNHDSTQAECIQWVGIMAAVLITASYCEQHWMFTSTKAGIRIRAGMTRLVYNKLTRISVHSLNDLSLGKIVNVIANDVNIFERRGLFLSTVFLGIPTLLGGVVILWSFYSWAALFGILYMILSIPIQQVLIKASTRPQTEKNAITDERVKLTNELIEGIKLLKMYAWELIFARSIKNLRNKEIVLLKRGAVFEGIARGVALSVTAMSSFLTFVVYTQLLKKKLDITTVFPTFFIMGFLRVNVILYTIGGFSFIAETKLIFKRIKEIMDAPEISRRSITRPVNPENSVEFHNFTGYWSKPAEKEEKIPPVENGASEEAPVAHESQPALREINLGIKKGSLQAVIGTVGSGKSSLLLSFTGEMPRTAGELRFSGTIAYAEQEPTIFPGLLRDNILLGHLFNPVLYKEVIEACCLEDDFKQFDHGDLTEIGEKGANLSGGQKARISLARAIYSQADIYLLDDPLSAVDTKVAKKLYDQAICGVLKRKTVILVTHQVHFVKDQENIIVMADGRAIGQGSFEHLKSIDIDVDTLFSVEKQNASIIKTSSKQSPLLKRATSSFSESIANGNNIHIGSNIEHDEQGEANEEVEEVIAPVKKEGNGDATGQLVAAEDPRSAKVTWTTYSKYMNAMGNKCFLLIVAIIFIGAVGSDLSFAKFLGSWANESMTQDRAILICGILTAVIFVAYLTKSIVFTAVFLTGAKNLHNTMVDRVVRSPPEFFDTNPVGRIINRFTSDVGVLDKSLPIPLEDVFTISFAFLGIVAAIGVINPVALGPIGFGGLIVFGMTRFCQEGIKQTKIADLNSKSPVYSLFSLTLSGLITIRAYDQAEKFKEKFGKLLDTNLSANLSFCCNNQFLGIAVDLIYTLISIATISLLVLLRGSSDSSLIGLTLSFILILNGMLQYNLRTLIQTKILMASTARVVSYCNLKTELPLQNEGDGQLQQAGWPQRGVIEFKDVYMKYRENSEYVIRGLTFKVQPGEKIGCIGRTGAGKSSILQILFRMVEIETAETAPQNSYIKIDGVNTMSVGLHLLRSKISIIPQTPIVFSGTIKKNLDLLDEYTDEELWKVLEEVNLKEYVEGIEGQLYADMTNTASVFSVGQKQLICLARAILKKSKIVVLDEATANVDSQTDNFIQDKILTKFKHCTVFTIAHRLSTIANYDKVLVLDQGKIAEFDAPYRLLVRQLGDETITNKFGNFASMVLHTGNKASQTIFNKAKKHFYKED